MVYLGKPSRGCLVCRRRHVKCDEGVPHCSYCVKRQVACEYKSHFDVVWRDQNLVAKSSVERRRRDTEKVDGGPSAVTTPARLCSPSVPSGLSQVYEDDALELFFSSYVFLPRDEKADGEPSILTAPARLPSPNIPRGLSLDYEGHALDLFLGSYVLLPRDEKVDGEPSALTASARLSSPSIPRGLSQDYDGYALDFFFSSYVFLPRDSGIRRGFFECLHPVWVAAEPTSLLRPAVAAVAACMLEAWSEITPDLPLSLSHWWYAKAVTALRREIQSTRDLGPDALLAALLLDMYDGTRSFTRCQINNSAHASGAMALVGRLRLSPSTSEIAQTVLLGARSKLVRRALWNVESVPPHVRDWVGDIAKPPGLLLDQLDIELASLQVLMSQIIAGTMPDLDVVDILHKAVDLDQRYLAWAHHIPANWLPVRASGQSIPPSVRDAGLYQSHCDVYESVFIAHKLNAYRCSRLRVQLVTLACADRLGGSPSATAAASAAQHTSQYLADAMCASVPCHLGDRNGFARIDDRNVQYPHAGAFGSSEDHRRSAAAFAGVFLTARLPRLLSPGLALRAGQRQWVGEQMQRVRRVYSVRPETVFRA